MARGDADAVNGHIRVMLWRLKRSAETRREATMITGKLMSAAVLGGAALGVLSAAPAHADPPCAQFNTCQYMPNPYNGGPLMPTWDVPGTYGGWTNLPVMCDPATYRCRQYIPNP